MLEIEPEGRRLARRSHQGGGPIRIDLDPHKDRPTSPIKSIERRYDALVGQIAGLNGWHAIRLSVEGVENVHNLANADIQDLIRNTRFSVQQIFDWVDQAVLLIHLASAEEFSKLQALGAAIQRV